MAICITDFKTEEEQLLLDFYTACPGATWVDAAEALRMEEDHVWRVSLRLVSYRDLALEYHAFELSQFWPVDVYAALPISLEAVSERCA